MKWLTEKTRLLCAHTTGTATVKDHAQSFVTIEGAHVAIGEDPAGSSISACSLPAPAKLCTTTLKVLTGHSTLVFINRTPICMQTLTGLTDSVPPAIYTVLSVQQDLVGSSE